MAKNYQILETISENITLSAANTYTEKELTLLEDIGKEIGKKSKSIKGLTVWGIAIELVSGFDGAGVDNGDYIEVQITTNSETGIVELIDKDLFWKKKIRLDDATAVGFVFVDDVMYMWFPQPLPYIKKRMWIGVNSNGLASAVDMNVRIFHGYGYFSETQMTRMIRAKI